MTPADILQAIAKAKPEEPVYTIWNALCPYIDASYHLSAAERLAYALAPDWTEHLRN